MKIKKVNSTDYEFCTIHIRYLQEKSACIIQIMFTDKWIGTSSLRGSKNFLEWIIKVLNPTSRRTVYIEQISRHAVF